MNTTTYAGHIQNGAAVLDNEAVLPEGARVRVEVESAVEPQSNEAECGETLGQRLLRFAGTVHGLPSDMADQHDHYIHGCPKQ